MGNLNELLKVVVAHKGPEKNPKIYIDIFTNIRIDDIIDNTKRKPIIPNDAEIIEIGSDNLVLISQGKYILNWDRDQIVNINLSPKKTRHCINQQQIKIEIK